jgi:hypothetical protein
MKEIRQIINIIKEYYDDDIIKNIYSDAYDKKDFEKIIKSPDNKTYDLIKNRHEFDVFKDTTKAKEINSKLKKLFPILNSFNFESEMIGKDIFLYYNFEKEINEKSYYIDLTFAYKHNHRFDITLSFDYFNEDDEDYQLTANQLEMMDTTLTNLDENKLKTAISLINKKIKEFQNMF